MINIIVAGAAGKMGGEFIKAVLDSPELNLAGAFEQKAHPKIGMDAGLVTGVGELGLPIAGDVSEIIEAADVLIDFTDAGATVDIAEKVYKAGKALVIGTSGLSGDQKRRIQELSKDISIVLAANTSMGGSLLCNIVGDMARVLGTSYDIEIIETHHRYKKDAPSGTAELLADELSKVMAKEKPVSKVYGRQGLVGPRPSNEIAILSVRGGDVVSEHTVIFAGIGERIEITHRAHSRIPYIQGALNAAIWLHDKPPGLYNMKDVIGL